MQPMEAAISEVDWTTLTGSYHDTDDDFMAQLLHNIDLGLGSGSGSGSGSELGDSAWFGIDQTTFHALNSANFFPQTDFYGRPVTYPNVTSHHFHDPYLNLLTQHNPALCGGGSPSVEPDVIEGEDYLNHEMEEEATAVNCLRKRSRSAENVKEMKRANKLKKNKSSVNLLSTSSSDDDSSDSQKNGQGLSRSSKKPPLAVNLSGKTRAARGSATDPQSVYARKRRERINERLKTLQNLIPNGTKVDISTMLEEAVHYVKFLQHQIKLLSSDDHWMYAPIAYNGTNVGLDLNLNELR